MKVYISGGMFIAEGDYQECAAWAYSMITLEREREEAMRKKTEEKESEQLRELLNTEFIELVRREREEGQSHE